MTHQDQSRAEFDAWVRTHEQDHGALDEPSALAGWQAQDALHLQELGAYRMTVDNLEAVKVALLAALKRCRFDSLNMSLADLEFCRAAIARAEGGAA